jgi:hypothetical protein
MEFKGTKNNWRIIEKGIFGGDNHYQNIKAGIQYFDNNKPNAGFNITGFMSKENALLISKAPVMFEMLKVILEDKCDIPEWKKEMAFKIIKEATTI